MQADHKNWLMELGELEPPKGLYARILLRIELRKRCLARIKLFFTAFTGLAAAFLSVPAFQYAYQEFYRSGIYHYLSLVFSDGGVVLAYWKEFGLLIAESVPVLAVLALVSVIFVFLASLRLLIKNIKLARVSLRAI